MLGEKSNWVRNVRTSGGEALLIHGRRRSVRLVEVPPGQRAPIIRRYLLFAISARPHVDVSWRAPLSKIESVADLYSVFRIAER
jgi:hypothetical protein